MFKFENAFLLNGKQLAAARVPAMRNDTSMVPVVDGLKARADMFLAMPNPSVAHKPEVPSAMATVEQHFRMFGRQLTPGAYLAVAAAEGVNFHFGQSAEDVTLLRLFKKKKGGFYVDVGAYHPRKYSNTYVLHRFWGWNGINIDASAEAIALFEQERPGDVNLHTAVGFSADEAVYWKFDKPARNTFSEANLQRQYAKGDVEVTGQERIHVRPLADILAEHVPDEKVIDLLDVDAEGLDIEVLQSNDWQRFRPQVVLVEDYSVQTKGLENSEIYSYMKQVGYKFISHTFDTSIYVEEGTWIQGLDTLGDAPGATKEQKVLLNDNLLSEIPGVIERAGALVKAHPEWGRMSSKISVLEGELANERERNRELTAQVQKMAQEQLSQLQEELKVMYIRNEELIDSLNKKETELKEIMSKYKDVMREQRYFEKRYSWIKQSRIWRYMTPVRKMADMVKRVLKLKFKRTHK